MKITIKEWQELQVDRDALVSRIAELTARPENGSLSAIADHVTSGMRSLTPDQSQQVRDLIMKSNG